VAKDRGRANPVPVPQRPGDPSTIKHVFLIVKENRTYDQVFADDPRGNGDPAFTQFGENVTPNQHALELLVESGFTPLEAIRIGVEKGPDEGYRAEAAFTTRRRALTIITRPKWSWRLPRAGGVSTPKKPMSTCSATQ